MLASLKGLEPTPDGQFYVRNFALSSGISSKNSLRDLWRGSTLLAPPASKATVTALPLPPKLLISL